VELAKFGREHQWIERTNPDYLGKPMWLGKRFLLGAGWRGVKELGDETVREAAETRTLAQIAGEVSAERKLDLPPDAVDLDDAAFWDEVERRAK
jgi:hypothetical protein